jgi:hypothetical protein
VPEREVVEAGRRDLLLRDDDLVAVRTVGDRERAVDDADVPRRPRLRRRVDVHVAERAVRRALRREDRGVDRRVEGGRWSAGWSGVITVTKSSSAVLPASALRS